MILFDGCEVAYSHFIKKQFAQVLQVKKSFYFAIACLAIAVGVIAISQYMISHYIMQTFDN